VRILVLDDDLRRHAVFANNLQGHEVTHVHTYNTMLKTLLTQPPFDLVYLDYDLNDFGAFSIGPSSSGGLRKLTGADVALFIISKLPKERQPKRAVIHSWNDGAAMISRILRIGGVPFRDEMFHDKINV
jgi:CheY-like chemotaxis protein